MEQAFIYIVYIAIGWLIIPMIFKLSSIATEFGRTLLVREKSQLLGQAIELITFGSLVICIIPYLGQLLIFYEDLVLTSAPEIEPKIRARWLFLGLVSNIVMLVWTQKK
jgi:hypothetical protein